MLSSDARSSGKAIEMLSQEEQLNKQASRFFVPRKTSTASTTVSELLKFPELSSFNVQLIQTGSPLLSAAMEAAVVSFTELKVSRSNNMSEYFHFH